jgi:Domain of unknown function (DUF5076)
VPSELKIPPSVASDSKACELIRAWAAHGGLHCSLNPGVWPEDKAAIAWGVLLSDVARHVADALTKTYALDKKATLSKIRTVFDAELARPTADTKGEFV